MRPTLVLPLLLLACHAGDDGGGGDTDVVDSDAVVVAALADGVFARVGEAVTLDASASAGGTEARWDLGDGTRLDRAPGLTATHAWSAPGHYRVSVEVFGPGGASDVDEIEVTVTWPTVTTRASSTIAVAYGRAYVALPDFDAVAVVDLATNGVVGHLDGCERPRRLSFAPGPDEAVDAGVLAVTCEEGAPGVVFFDVGPGGSLPRGRLDLTGTGRSPFGVVFDGDGVAWVTARGRGDEGGVLLRVDADGHLLGERALGDDLRGLAWADGRVYVSRHRSADDGGRIWAVTDADGVVGTYVLPLDTLPDSDAHSRGVPTYAEPIAVRPDGRVLAFGGLKANVLKGLSSVRDGEPLTQESTVRAELGVLALHPDEGDPGALLGEVRLDNLDHVSAVAFHPRGDLLFAALRGNRAVAVVDAYTRTTRGVYVGVGDVLEGLAVTPEGDRLLVDAAVSRELVVFDVGQVPGSAPVARIDLRPGGLEVLAADVLAGARIFATAADPRMTRDAYVSCASCHLDAEEDGRVWDFTQRGEGLRNTIGLRGMADRVGLPIHWSGNFDEVQDFEADIRGPQAGTGFLADALWHGAAGPTLGASKAGLSTGLDQLAAYVNHFRALDVPWDEDVSEGEAIFEAAGCAACHPADRDFSASGWVADEGAGRFPLLVDVGTLGPLSGHRLGGDLPGLDVPSLRGAWATAPYLHDGAAATLDDVVRPCVGPADRGCNRGDLHGVTSDLAPAERAALVRYLRAL